MKHTVDWAQILQEADCLIGADNVGWTGRQLRLYRAAMRAMVLTQQTFGRLEEAVNVRNWPAVELTLAQAKLHTAIALFTVTEPLLKAAKTSASSRESGRKAKGVARKLGHDWDAICRTYDKLKDEGKKRPIIVRLLSQKYEIRKDVLQRGLRKRGRGSKV